MKSILHCLRQNSLPLHEKHLVEVPRLPDDSERVAVSGTGVGDVLKIILPPNQYTGNGERRRREPKKIAF